MAKAFLAHFSSDLAVDLDKARDATQRRTPPAPTRPATLGPQTPMYTSARLLLHCAARPAPARLPAAAWQEVQEAKEGLRELLCFVCAVPARSRADFGLAHAV